ncbi:major facilitator superfamily domain-containing protein [Hysterangium stoloniferum]|nr:major facilitator superfamily domain-containing protein [Hysterangium stoloniferum]
MNINPEQNNEDLIREKSTPSIDIVEKNYTDDSLGFNPPSSAEPDSFDPAPDGGLTAWLVVLACFLLSFNILGILYSSGVYQAHYLLHQFPSDSAELIALIGTIYATLLLLTGFLASRFINLYGFRPASVVGTILFSGGLVAAGFCRTVPTLLATQGVVSGIGSGILYIPATTGPVQWFSTRRSLSIGLSSAGAGIGGIFWSFVTRAIISKLGYQWALWLSGAVSASINIIALFMLETRPSKSGPMRTSSWSELKVFKNAKFITLFLASVVSVLGYMVPFLYIPTYAQTQLKANALVGSVLAAIIDLGMTFGRIILGIVADSRLGALNSVIAGMMLAGISHFVLWLPSTNSLPLLYVFSFTYGFFGGAFSGMMPAVLVRIFDSNQLTSIMGIFSTSEVPGQLVGGPIAAAIFSHAHGDWTPVIIYSGMMLFCGSLLAIATRFQDIHTPAAHATTTSNTAQPLYHLCHQLTSATSRPAIVAPVRAVPNGNWPSSPILVSD